MADIAQLGFSVNSRELKAANAELALLPAKAGAAERATDRFNGAVDRGKKSLDQLAAGSKFNTAGIAAQFQDVGVTAAMGMNPLMIALQQGTQLAGQLSTMTGSLWKNLASGLASVISPLSLLTIGFIGLLAAGIQMVNWAKVAEAVLNKLADVIEPIAPYAALAAAGLALMFAPAIIGGIVSLVAALGRLAVQAVATGAALALANPVGALIAGLVAGVAAMVIFRDDLAKIFGRDIVEDVKNGVNFIIGTFVGGFNGIKATWSMLPAAINDLVIQAVNNTIGAVEGMLSGITNTINEWIRGINSTVGTSIGELGAVTFGRVDNPNEGAAAKVGGVIASEMSLAQSQDYVGQLVELVKRGASGAADALRGLADAAGKSGDKTDKAAKKAAEAYAKVTEGARQFIAEQQLEAHVLGMVTEQANALRYAQQLLNQATEGGKTITAAQRSELVGLANQMAAAEASTRSLTEAYEFGKSTFRSFFSDFKSDLMNGTSLWQSFANAALNALDKIADRLLGMAADGLFDMLFNGVMSGISGGMGTTGKGFIPGITGPKLFASGGYTGDISTGKAAGVVHGQEYVLNAQATRRIGVGTLNAMNDNMTLPSNSNSRGPVQLSLAVHNEYNGLGLSREEVEELQRAGNEQLMNGLPDILASIEADPRKRRAS